MSDFIAIDQVISRINALISENEQCQETIKKLERDLLQVQEQLEYYYLLSREQSKVLESNQQLHEQAITLLAQVF